MSNKLIVSTSGDKSAIVRNIETGEIIKILKDHTSYACKVCSSNDGTRYATTSGDKTARIYDREMNKCIHILNGHTEYVWAIDFSKDDMYVATGSSDKTCRLWLNTTGACIRTFTGHTEGVWACKFLSDGKTIVTGSGDKTIRVWNLKTGECTKTIQGHTSFIVCISLSLDGTKIVSGSGDNTCRLWDAKTGKQIQLFEGHDGSVRCVRFLPDEDFIISGSDDGTIRIWEVNTGNQVKIFKGHTSSVQEIDVSQDGTQIISASDDKTVRLWDSKTGKVIKVFSDHTDRVYGVCFLRESLEMDEDVSFKKIDSKTTSKVANKVVEEIADDDSEQVVFDFLKTVGINAAAQQLYGKILLEEGYDTIPMLKKLNASKLKDIKIEKKAHVDEILDAISKIGLDSTKKEVINLHLFFISYVKIDSLAETKLFKDIAKKKLGDKISIFHDIEAHFELSALIENVKASKNIVVFLSPNYCTSPYCMIELVTSYRCKANIVVVNVHKPWPKDVEPFSFDKLNAKLKVNDVKSLLDDRGWGILEGNGISEDDLCNALKAVMNVKAFDLNVNQPDDVTSLQINHVLNGLKMI